MNPATRARLELLEEYYCRVRRRTLRVVRSLAREDLEWKPGSGVPSAGQLLNGLLSREESQIHRRARGKASGTDAHGSPVLAQEFHDRLAALKRSTGRFLRGIRDGLERARSASLLRDLEELIEREVAVTGQVVMLHRLRRGAFPGVALITAVPRPIPPGRAVRAVTTREFPARKARV